MVCDPCPLFDPLPAKNQVDEKHEADKGKDEPGSGNHRQGPATEMYTGIQT